MNAPFRTKAGVAAGKLFASVVRMRDPDQGAPHIMWTIERDLGLGLERDVLGHSCRRPTETAMIVAETATTERRSGEALG
jgi:hypothetical protein